MNMNKPTQAELMSAHKSARQNAHEAALDAPIEVPSNPTPFPDYAHPFSGNENNKRVAQRIAKESPNPPAPTVEIIPAHVAAQRALDAAAAFEAENPSAPEADPENDGGAGAIIAAGLGGKPSAPTVLPPVPQQAGGTVPPVPPAYTG